MHGVVPGLHKHQECRGELARRSALYTTELVSAIADCVLNLSASQIQSECSSAQPLSTLQKYALVQDLMGPVGQEEPEGAVAEPADAEPAEAAEAAEPERKPRVVPAPQRPTAEEVLEHNVTHMPYRPWCPHCVKGRSVEDPHKSRHKSLPAEEEEPQYEVQWDYSFLRAASEAEQVPVLLATVLQVNYCMALIITEKGLRTAAVMKYILSFLNESGALAARIVHRSDPEPSIIAFLNALVLAKPGTRMRFEQSPVASHQSVGAVSRFARTMAGLARTLRSQVETLWGITLRASHPCTSWLIRHVSFLHNRFSVRRATGLTAYEEVAGEPYNQRLVPFSTPVLARPPGVTKPGTRFEPRMMEGIWVGIDGA